MIEFLSKCFVLGSIGMGVHIFYRLYRNNEFLQHERSLPRSAGPEAMARLDAHYTRLTGRDADDEDD